MRYLVSIFAMWSVSDLSYSQGRCLYWLSCKMYTDLREKNEVCNVFLGPFVSVWIIVVQGSVFSRHQLGLSLYSSYLWLPTIFCGFLQGHLFLSFSTPSTKLYSPPIITSSHLNYAKRSKTEVKKVGSSLFGAYKFGKVSCFLFVIQSQIIKRHPWGRGMLTKFEKWKYC